MKTLKALLEEVKVYNLDTDEELDLDALADLDFDDLFNSFDDDEFSDDDPQDLDFSGDIFSQNIDDFQLDGDFGSDDEFNDDLDSFDLDFFGGDDDEFGGDLDSFDLDSMDSGEFGDDTDLDDEFEDDLDSDELGDDLGLDGEEFEDEEDPDFQGDIRTVRGANLVYKRKREDGNFEELWIYNVGKDIKRETQIRRAILAGTDIDPSTQESNDREQHADTTTAGNVQFLHITGLPQ